MSAVLPKYVCQEITKKMLPPGLKHAHSMQLMAKQIKTEVTCRVHGVPGNSSRPLCLSWHELSILGPEMQGCTDSKGECLQWR